MRSDVVIGNDWFSHFLDFSAKLEMVWLIREKQPLEVISQHSASTVIWKRSNPPICDFGWIGRQGFDAEITCRPRGINKGMSANALSARLLTSPILNESVCGNGAILTTLPSAFDSDTILNSPPEPLFVSESSKLNRLRTTD